MNPLDMAGPEFLKLYLVWGVGGLLLAWTLRTVWLNAEDLSDARRWNPGHYPQDSEAYAIALLRGGRKEAVRTLLGRLVSGGLVAVTGRELQKLPTGGALPDLLPLERKAFAVLSSSQPAAQAGATVEASLEPDLRQMEDDLKRQGLVSSAPHKRISRRIAGLALLLIPGLGLLKLAVAIERGRSNIGFLMILLVLYTLASLLLFKLPRLTPAGRRYLTWLRESHQGLVRMITDGRRDRVNIPIAAAIFGLAAVPALAGLEGALPRRQVEGDASWSAGDSGGDSGGGDGGGGCGGCGGCGG